MTIPLWTIDLMAQAMDATAVNIASQEILDISIDTRSLTIGSAYFAIQGVQQDGHIFVEDAIEKGATVAVISKEKQSLFIEKKLPLLIVEDVLTALENLGKAARKRCDGKILAVTGSAGKTSTKEIMRSVYEKLGKTHASIGSLNNHWGVPLSLARLPKETEFAIFEVGMNHKDEIRQLIAMIRPHVAMVTTVGAAHLGHFKSVEEIAQAKAEIFSGLEPDGFAIIPQENQYQKILQEQAKEDGARLLTFGYNEGDVQIAHTLFENSGLTVDFKYRSSLYSIMLKSLSDHMILNAACVMASLCALNQNNPQSLSGFGNFRPGAGRGEISILNISHQSQKKQITLLDESYNANPLSMKATLNSLSKLQTSKAGRRVAILGDMLELGNFSKQMHEDLSTDIIANGIEPLFLVGSEMKALYNKIENKVPCYWTNQSSEMVDILIKQLKEGDIVLIKGSFGVKMKTIIDALKK